MPSWKKVALADATNTFTSDQIVDGGTTSRLIINSSTHNASVANEAILQLGFGHSGAPDAVGHIKLTENATNSFDGTITIGVPYNNGSGGSATRDALTIRQTGDVTFFQHANFPDNGKALFGASNDLQIYHNGVHSYINEGGTGNLIIYQGSNTAVFSPTAVTINRNATFSGSITASENTDTTFVFGRVALHSVSSDYATFSHYDHRSSGVNYALRQTANAATAVNAASGQRVNFNINNSTKMVVNSDGNVGIGTTSPTNKLSVYNDSAATSINIGKYASGKAVAVLGTSADTNGYFQIQSYYAQGSTFGDIVLNPQGGNVAIGSATPSSHHSSSNKLIVGNGSACGISIFSGTGLGKLAFARSNANNSDAFDGGINYDGNRNLTFHTNAGAERVRINSSGNVGIGATTNITSPAGIGRFLKIAHTSHAGIVLQDTNSTAYDIYSADGHVFFYSQSLAENTVKIEKDGDVGIGTTNPDALLHIEKAGGATLRIANSSDGMSDESHIGTIEFEGDDESTNRSGVMAKIVARYSDTGSGDSIDGSANEGGSLGFFTSIATTVGGSQTLAEKMRIENNGKVGINTTSPSDYLHVVGAIKAQDGSSSVDYTRMFHDGTNGHLISNRGQLRLGAQSDDDAITIDSSGKVGIGITNPADYYSNKLVVGNLGNNDGITLASASTSNSAYIMWADGTSGNSLYQCQVGYSHDLDRFGIWTAATNALLIDSSQNTTLTGNLSLSASSPQMNFSGSSGDYGTFGWTEGDPDIFAWRFHQNSGLTASITMDAFTENTAGGRIEFNTGASEVAVASIDSGGAFLGIDANGQTTTTELGGYGVLHTDGNRYGNYGWLTFNAPTNNYTGGARGWALTNGYLGTDFAILKASSASTEPYLTTGGGAGTGTIAPFRIDNSGNATFGGGVSMPTGNVSVGGKLNVASSVGIGDVGLEKTFSIAFANGVANQKAQIQFSRFWGELEISVSGTFSNQNNAGVITKKFGLGVQFGATYADESRYTESLGVTANNFAIGEKTYDSTNARYYIPIVHRVSTGNTCTVRVRCLGGDASQTDFIEGLTVSSVYTTDTTTYDKPEVSFISPIGIDTATPEASLHVHGSTGIRLTDSNQNANEYSEIKYDNAGNTNLHINNDWTNTNALISFELASSAKMVVRGDGNVGIGTTSPFKKLQVDFSGDDCGFRLNRTETTGERWNKIQFNLSSTGDTSYSHGMIGYKAGDSWDNTLFRQEIINGGVTETIAENHRGNTWRWYTGNTERLTIDSNGNIGIGTTSPTSPAGVGRFLHIANSSHAGIVLDDTGSTAYDIYNADGNLYFYSESASANTVVIDSSGNLTMNQDGNATFVMNSTVGSGGSSRIKLNAENTGSEGGEIYFQSDGTEKAKIYHHRDGILYLKAHHTKVLGSTGEERFHFQSEGASNPGVFMIKQSESATTIQLNSAGASYINANANVGINVPSPQSSLHIGSKDGWNVSGATISLGASQSDAYNRRVAIGARKTGADDDYLGIDFQTHPGAHHQNDAPVTKMTLDHNGKLGIGTDTPLKLLHLHQANSNALFEAVNIRTNSSGEGLALGVNADNSSYVCNSASSNALHLGGSSSTINGTGHITIKGTGYVGVGQGTPVTKLDVNGAIRVNNTLPAPLSSGVSGMVFDYGSSYGRFWSRGGDATTAGGFKFISQENDGGGEITPLQIGGTGDITILAGKKLFLDGSNNTYLYESSDGVIDFFGDNVHLASFKQNGTQSEVVVNEGSGDVDFRVESNHDQHAFFVDAENGGKVGIKNSSPTEALDVTGNITCSGVILAPTYATFIHSFTDNLGTVAHYIPWNSSAETTGNDFSATSFVAPMNMTLKRLYVRVETISNLGSHTLTATLVSKPDGSISNTAVANASKSLTAASSGRNQKFTDSQFSSPPTLTRGQMGSIKLKFGSDIGGSTDFFITSVWEMDNNTL